MMRIKVLTIWVVLFVALGFVLPRPASALPDPDRQTRIAASSGEGDTVISPRIPRRRAEIYADLVSLHVAPAGHSGIFPAISAKTPTIPDHTLCFLKPSTGAGVTRAGPSLLSEK